MNRLRRPMCGRSMTVYDLPAISPPGFRAMPHDHNLGSRTRRVSEIGHSPKQNIEPAGGSETFRTSDGEAIRELKTLKP